MKSKQIVFFAILSDMEPILKKVESSLSVQYFKTGLLDSRDIPHYQSIFDAPDLGFTLSGDWNRTDSYLVLPKTISLNIRDVPQRAGGVKYAVDQSVNGKSVELKVGGIYKDKEHILVAGLIGTISEDDFSVDTFKLFSSLIRKEFKKIGSFYVGKSAEEKLRSGWRLVTNDKSPKEYDLAVS
jgi:hypothetical protein